MWRVHPSETNNKLDAGEASAAVTRSDRLSVWTVWKKSSMAFQGTDGFSVYDDRGSLAFRVDNYSRRHKDLLLMDGGGRPLLTLRPQMLSMHDQWNGFKGEEESPRARPKSPIFSMRRRSILQSGDEAEVFMGSRSTIGHSAAPDFRIEGCFSRRSCKIRGRSGEVVAQITRKKASTSVVLSDDVFSLVVWPGTDCQLIMAFIVVMDRICHKPYSTLMCS